MNDPVFIDTSGWIALLNRRDQDHAAASERMDEFRRARRILVMTDWVFAEAGNGLARTMARLQFVAAARSFLQSTRGRFLWIDDDLFHQALALYEQMDDKTWGLVDCASILIMQAEGMTEALTSDRHFQQAGFRCLLPLA
ncbi:MAG: type II toxin-antitoxin system VapC family toxin [Isosphaeraceae bacterium]|nr:type II toxin-antitoxin system VapC family toxin [Isosphaeraceae bacterium]